MRDLTLTQEYFICAVNEKGKLSTFSTEKQVCLVAAGLLELQLENCIVIDQKHITVTGALPANKRYLESLYQVIHQAKPIKLEKVLETYTFSFSDKKLNELMDSIGGALESMGLAESAKAGLFGGKKAFIPTKEAIHSVVELVRAELLEDGDVTDEIAALVVLLEKSKSLKPYFSDYERKELKNRLNELVRSPQGKLVKDMVDYVEDLIVIMSVISASVNS